MGIQDLSHYHVVTPAPSAGGNLYEAERKADGAAVWIKVLPGALARDAALMQRLKERLARLPQHENLQRILEVSSEGDIAFCVLERLQGITLKDRLAKGPYRASETDARFAELLTEEKPAGDVATAAQEKPATETNPAPGPAPIPPPKPIAQAPKFLDQNLGLIAPPDSTPVPARTVRRLQVEDKVFEWDVSPPPWEKPSAIPKFEMTPAMSDLLRGYRLVSWSPATLLHELAIYKFAAQVLRALQVVHKAGFALSALNPANIFICAQDTPKLMNVEDCLLRDLSGGEDASADQNQDKTAKESGADVVAYQSPEQAIGRTIDARSDLFSLGSILYEMATGARAFTESTVGELRHSIARRENLMPQPLYPTNIAQLNGVIVKALERDRGMRYKTAGDMLAVIEPLKTAVERQLQQLRDSRNAAKDNANVAQPPIASADAVAASGKAGLNFKATSATDPLRDLPTLDVTNKPDDSPPHQIDAEIGHSKVRYAWSRISHPRLVTAGLVVIGAAILALLLMYVAATWHPR